MQLPSILQGESRDAPDPGRRRRRPAHHGPRLRLGRLAAAKHGAEDGRACSVNKALVAALAPICVDKFRQAADVKATTVALNATDTWKRDTFVEKGGWATFPGAAEPNRDVAEACATILSAK